MVNEKLKDLLLKVRKKATASLGSSHWALILPALGFGFEVMKRERRTLLAVRITAPNGAVLDVAKEPSCRYIVFYSLKPWALKQGAPLHDLAARALGLPTLQEEREAKDYEARDWTHTGTCGVCEQNIKMEALGESTKLVLHGYRRPGDGQAHGQCFGRGYPPHELAPDAARGFLTQVLTPERDRCASYLGALRGGRIKRLIQQPASRANGYQTKYIEDGDPAWPRFLASEIGQAETHFTSAHFQVQRFTAKVAAWKLDELPEIKLARLHRRRERGRALALSRPLDEESTMMKPSLGPAISAAAPAIARTRCTASSGTSMQESPARCIRMPQFLSRIPSGSWPPDEPPLIGETTDGTDSATWN